MEGYKRILFMGIIVIALGVIFTSTLKDTLGSLAVVFIGIGGLFSIAGMSRKKKEEDEAKKQRRK